MTFHTPTPKPRIRREAEETDVILVRITAFPPVPAVPIFQKIEYLFQTHHIQSLIVSRIRQPTTNQALCRFQGGTFERLERKTLARAGNKVPVEPLRIIKAK